MQPSIAQRVNVVQKRCCSADIRFSFFAVRATSWCPAGSRASGKHIQVRRCHMAHIPGRSEQAGLPGFDHLAVLTFVTSL